MTAKQKKTPKRAPVATRPTKVPGTLLASKILISNSAALKSKYGNVGFNSLRGALATLIASDKKRGVVTTEMYIDDSVTMAKVGGLPVARVGDQLATKAAIDALATANPHSDLVIVGAGDVVSLQDLDNPAWTGNRNDDPDQIVPSDLPYACAAPSSRDIRAFVAPTRIVSRIPDQFGAGDPSYLLRCLETVTQWKTRQPKDYATAFVVSADVWKGSTRQSASSLFGSSQATYVSPPQGPGWTAKEVSPRFHFINCHGAPADPTFYGQQGNSFPHAVEAQQLSGLITEGTVTAAECCYGAELYDPSLAPSMGICSMYLHERAYGFLGSTTVAYGPANAPNGYADVICQYFIDEIQSGSTQGQAMLAARTRYVSGSGTLDPIGLKTLAQFLLLGDSNIQPVASRKRARALVHALPGGGGGRAGATRKVSGAPTDTTPAAVRKMMLAKAQDEGLQLGKIMTFASMPTEANPERALAHGLAAALPAQGQIHMAFASNPNVSKKTSESERGPTARKVVILATEEADKITGIVEIWQKALAF